MAGTIRLAIITRPNKDGPGEWFAPTWGFARQTLPWFPAEVRAAGLLLGRPGHEGLIPNARVARFVRGNSLAANFTAALLGPSCTSPP